MSSTLTTADINLSVLMGTELDASGASVLDPTTTYIECLTPLPDMEAESGNPLAMKRFVRLSDLIAYVSAAAKGE